MSDLWVIPDEWIVVRYDSSNQPRTIEREFINEAELREWLKDQPFHEMLHIFKLVSYG